MRLHHLSMSAFGPFAGTAEVDFDELCGAGLFLLAGPTGAGKTTVLDAVSFALYGTVPGDRGVKTLRSHHAAPEARPEVRLDFTVRGRRFVIRRSPEWSRPKRRGVGFTSEHARATLLELADGEERLLSSRAQEVGHFVGELIGMQSTQFQQVAMLPQGDFQRFLRASSQERHDVLQHLFRTDRFARIEGWVHDHSRALRTDAAAAEADVRRVVDTLADRAAVDAPEGLDSDHRDGKDVADAVREWSLRCTEAAVAARDRAGAAHAEAVSRAAAARGALQEAERTNGLLGRRDAAHADLAELASDARTAEATDRRLADDGRARACLPLLQMLRDAREEQSRTARAAASALSRVDLRRRGDLLGGEHLPAEAAGLHVLVEGARAAAARVEALLPREAGLTSLREEQATVARDLRSVSVEHASARERAEVLPPLLEEAEHRVAELGRAGGRTEALTVQLEQARLRLDAVGRLEECLHMLGEVRERQRAARDRAADAREHALELTQRRLTGIAAELAAALEPGDACQVCGSTEHPAPARPAADAVSEAQQAAAEADHERLRSVHADLTGQAAQLEERVVALRGLAAGQSPAAARSDVEDLERQLHEAERATAELGVAEQELARLQQEQRSVHDVLRDLDTRLATTEHAAQTLEATIREATLELEQALDPTWRAWLPSTGHGGLSALAARVHELAEALTEAYETQRAHEELSRRCAEIESRVASAAAEHGFDDLATLEDAVLEDAERDRATHWLEERALRAVRAREILDEADVRAVADRQLLDTEPLAAALAEAEQEESVTVRDLHQREEALAAIRRLGERLDEALESWLPVREEARRAEAIAQLVRGTGPENQLQMRLSAYVLATRLDQVVAAANERLGQMRDRRYLLQRTGRAARRNARAGLGLEVVDQWTGEVREATTLSGGETFVVSLALALGLADVVTYEAGGTEIQTLFVDEGFGTLDEEMLDDVMDRLDELRSGGRAVGVVSHVSELRNRIPTQLHVTKTRTGSALTIRTAVG